MSILGIAAAIFALVLIGLVVWVLVQNTQDQKKNEQLESQLNELRRDLLGLSTSQTQSSTKMETIAGTVAERLEAVTQALQSGIKDSAQTTSQITSQAQVAMATELKNTLGGTKSRGSFGEVALERLLEDCLPPSQYEMQYRFRSGEAADAVLKLRDGKKMAIDSKFPLEAYLRLTSEGEEARRAFVTAVKG